VTNEEVSEMVQGALSVLEAKKDTPWDRDARKFAAEMLKRGDADYETIASRATTMADAVERSRNSRRAASH
jgi:hypothetical protein